jgi:hypothetical protein
MNLEEFRAHVKALENADRRVRRAYRDQKELPGGTRNDTPDTLSGRKPKVTRLVSPRQRQALSQTDDATKAIYDHGGTDPRPTPIYTGDRSRLTLDVGGNCESLNSGFHGKDTRTRTGDGRR